MKNFTAVVLESNIAVAEQLKAGLEAKECTVTYVGDDAGSKRFPWYLSAVY